MSELVGYKLIAPDGSTFAQWGGTRGQTPGVPNLLMLPNDVQVYCPELGASYDGYVLTEWTIEPPLPSGVDVDAERDRRRYLPISVTTSPTGTFSVNMDSTSQANIQGLVTVGMYLQSAAPTQTTVFRDYANAEHSLLPSELIAMGLQVAAYIQKVYEKSWALKAISPIPSDYAGDSYWT